MKNKYYILAFTFLCLLIRQSGYAQDYDMDGDELDIVCIGCDHVGEDGWWQYETSQTFEQLATITVTRTPSYNSTTAMNYSILVNSINASNPNQYVVYDNYTGQYVVLSSSTDQSSQVRSWYYDYDGDNYSSIGGSLESESSPGYYWKDRTYGQDCDDYDASITTECYTTFFEDKDNDGYGAAGISWKRNITSPDIGWREGTSLGTDCDDNKYDPTNNCCTTVCSSGYKLNSDTCGCELLPPCFGTTVEGLMPDGSGDQNGLVEALGTMVNSFFKSSDLLDTMKTIGVLDPAELSKGFDNYLKGGNLMGQLSIGFVANDYNNNPTTENFMKIIVEGALLLLPPPASVGYTAIDTAYQKYFDGKPFSEILAQKMAEKSAELFDCDLGSGVYGMFH